MDQESTSRLTNYPFKFTGSGGEFFKIWIVNVLLTVLTLGIYSAWAKVRTNRYFYGNTMLNDASFEYLASPIAILKGRLLALGLFIIYSVVSNLSPIAGMVVFLLFFAATPYIIVKAISFQHRMSAYRNIRFDFTGFYKEAAMVNLVWPLLGVLTLGLLYPLAHQRFVSFYVKNSTYGKASFDNNALTSSFYNLYLILLAMTVGLVLAVFAIPFLFLDGVNIFDFNNFRHLDRSIGIILVGLGSISYIALYLIIFAFFKSKVVNLIMSTTTLGDNFHFTSTLSLGKMTWLLSVNALAIICTAGLAYPWAKVRLAQYRADQTQCVSTASLDDFVGDNIQTSNAIGEEIGEMFDIGAGL
ncbi:MAG: YjgN family protein [Mariprofundaceae bacterium]|nr:YjgN family protein [Mariprofundaceae bacterium]